MARSHLQEVDPSENGGGMTIASDPELVQYGSSYLAVATGTTTAVAVPLPYGPGHVLTDVEAKVLSRAWLDGMVGSAGSELTRSERSGQSDDEKREYLRTFAASYTFKGTRAFSRSILETAVARLAHAALVGNGTLVAIAADVTNRDDAVAKALDELAEELKTRNAPDPRVQMLTDPTRHARWRDKVLAECQTMLASPPPPRTRAKKVSKSIDASAVNDAI